MHRRRTAAGVWLFLSPPEDRRGVVASVTKGNTGHIRFLTMVIIKPIVPLALRFPRCLEEQLAANRDATEQTQGVVGSCNAIDDISLCLGELQLMSVWNRDGERVVQTIPDEPGHFEDTAIAEIFVRDLISYFSHVRLKVRELVAFKNHARITVYATRPRCTKIYSVRKLINARVRNFTRSKISAITVL